MAPEQQNLFETQPPAWEVDAAAELLVATIALPSGPPEPLDYAVSDRLRDAIAVGRRVRVPLGRGNRSIAGYCVALETRSGITRQLKEVKEVLDNRTLLTPSMMRLTQWMSQYYLCPWGQALDAVLPAGVRGAAGTRLTTFVSVRGDLTTPVAELKLPEKQAAVLAYLAAQPAPITRPQLAEAVGCTQAPIAALVQKGLIVSQQRRVWSGRPEAAAPATETQLQLNDDQRSALAAILGALQAAVHQTLVLHGVTGSGKTEVYLQAIREVISYGRQAIVLVPEISLTPQTEARFCSRFGRVAVLHSHLSDAERHRHWENIAAGHVHVVVGARSAVFAPTPQLGLIVLDEEHESTFKQESAPRYHARDVARWRAADAGVPLVLGSATPALETFYRAQQGADRLLRLPKRVFDRPMPAVAPIDLRTEVRDKNSRGAISRQLHTAMHEALRDGGQVILLLNRRGFSTHIQCPSCGEPVRCPQCDIALTHHKQHRVVLCHYCDHREPVPEACPKCGFAGMRFGGRGTQRLEDEIRARFADYQCLRMDTDSMQRPGSHRAALARFEKGEVQILLGTQMIAKGLDFPNVTLVGVINADTALHLPDFRAAERTFQLVTQVAGRSGRGPRGGRVLVQTFEPEHIAIRAAVRHDYEMFATQELDLRRSRGYPPFGAMIRALVRGPDERATRDFAKQLGGQIEETAKQQGVAVRMLGPAPAELARLRGKYRFNIQLQAAQHEPISATARAVLQSVKPPSDIHYYFDVDPYDML